MRALIVYESMFGNTHAIADSIAKGFRPEDEVRVVAVAGATREVVDWADLLVVGGPTHAHGLSREMTRKSAREAVAKPGSRLTMDPSAAGPGLRDWFQDVGPQYGRDAAMFDTRLDAPAMFTGHASKGIDHRLLQCGARIVTEAESFLVNRENQLVAGELARAQEWGASLAGLPVDVQGGVAAH